MSSSTCLPRLWQRRWLRKPENRDDFRGPDNVRRVRRWRRALETDFLRLRQKWCIKRSVKRSPSGRFSTWLSK